jgi:hypothetical protein
MIRRKISTICKIEIRLEEATENITGLYYHLGNGTRGKMIIAGTIAIVVQEGTENKKVGRRKSCKHRRKEKKRKQNELFNEQHPSSSDDRHEK